jgi:hypothetical protein
MFRNVPSALRKSSHPAPRATTRKTCLHVEGLEERACPATLQQYAAAIDQEVAAAAMQFAYDAAAVEWQAPTVLSGAIYSDLVQIYNDAQAEAIVEVFRDFQVLGQDMKLELRYVGQYRLPYTDALASSLVSNTPLASDYARLEGDEALTIQFVHYVASQNGTTAAPGSQSGIPWYEELYQSGWGSSIEQYYLGRGIHTGAGQSPSDLQSQLPGVFNEKSG